MGEMKELYCSFFFLHLLLQSGADVHSINGYFMGSQGLSLPEYVERISVDDVTVFYYDSSMEGTCPVPTPEWLNTSVGRQHWNDITLISQHNKHSMISALHTAALQFNRTASASDVNVYQAHSRCELSPNGTLTAVITHAFNGKDFLTFDIDQKAYIAVVPQAVVYKRQREANPVFLEIMVSFYKKTCFERLKVFLQHIPEVFMKKAPEIRLFERINYGSTLLTCHVTGFSPREVQVEWVGPSLQPVGEESVLPNGDGTFQTRRSVIRPEKNPEEHTYSCVVRHSSVPGNITKNWVADGHTGLAVWICLLFMVLSITGGGLVLRRFCRRPDAAI